jgi:SAM-dependent methyltransferase
MLDRCDVGEGMRVLDVATGPGYVALQAASRSAEVTALDFSANMLSIARGNQKLYHEELARLEESINNTENPQPNARPGEEGFASIADQRARMPPIEFVQGDAEQLPFDDESFDAITCNFGILVQFIVKLNYVVWLVGGVNGLGRQLLGFRVHFGLVRDHVVF